MVDERAFVERRKADWERLAQMLSRTRFGLSKLSESELRELGRLYRRAASDLAEASAKRASPELIAYLNGLVGRAHGAIYTTERGSIRSAKIFLTGGFPALVRAHYPYVLATFLIFFAPFLYAFTDAIRAGEGSELWFGLGGALPATPDPVLMSSAILTNNITVAFVAFAGGITFGVLTVVSMLRNGFYIGQIAGTVAASGKGMNILSFVLPHGVIELAAIFIAGAGGLMMGTALIRPGNLSRKDALKVAARPAVRMVGGVIVMLILAGIIEGFLSPSKIPGSVKLAFGGTTAALVLVYFLGAGRGIESDGSNRWRR